MGWIVLGVLVLFGFFLIGMYNSLVQLRALGLRVVRH
jgi:hypothetical protein